MTQPGSEDGASQADLKRTRRVRPAQRAQQVDRLPPQSMEAETGVLGCILISPKECMPEAILALGSYGAEAFFDLRHYTIFNTMVMMHEAMIPIDVITLHQRLRDNQMLEQVGGLTYLSSLPDVVPSAANLSYYLEIVKEKYLLRRLIHTCTDVVSRVYEHEGDVGHLFDDFERSALNIRAGSDVRALVPMKQHVSSAIQKIEDYHTKKLGCVGLTTGFTDLDKMTSGLIPGEMWVIAARPSMGKTSLAMNIAEHVAADLRLPVGVFSLETNADILTMRMICSRAHVNLRNIQDGFLADRDFPRLTGAAGKISNAPIWIDDESRTPIDKLQAKARRMVQQYGVKLFVVDYLQLLQAFIGRRRIDNRAQEVAEISSGIKAIAKELHVPVIALSQVDRGLDKNPDRKPVMADLRESGAIENDADLIAFLYSPKREDTDDDIDLDAAPVKLLIAKQKNGPKGEIDLTFLKSFTRFESAAKISDEDVDQGKLV